MGWSLRSLRFCMFPEGPHESAQGGGQLNSFTLSEEKKFFFLNDVGFPYFSMRGSVRFSPSRAAAAKKGHHKRMRAENKSL